MSERSRIDWALFGKRFALLLFLVLVLDKYGGWSFRQFTGGLGRLLRGEEPTWTTLNAPGSGIEHVAPHVFRPPVREAILAIRKLELREVRIDESFARLQDKYPESHDFTQRIVEAIWPVHVRPDARVVLAARGARLSGVAAEPATNNGTAEGPRPAPRSGPGRGSEPANRGAFGVESGAGAASGTESAAGAAAGAGPAGVCRELWTGEEVSLVACGS